MVSALDDASSTAATGGTVPDAGDRHGLGHDVVLAGTDALPLDGVDGAGRSSRRERGGSPRACGPARPGGRRYHPSCGR